MALHYAKEMLKLENIADTHKLLGYLYAAESCIMLDRIPDAITFLDPKLMMDLKSPDFETRSSPEWSINKWDFFSLTVLNKNQGVDHELKRDNFFFKFKKIKKFKIFWKFFKFFGKFLIFF